MKILVFTKNWLGDVLFQLPAIEIILRKYPEAKIVCACPERCRGILETQPSVARTLLFDERKEHRSLFAKYRFVRALRREGFDQVYLFHRSRTRAFLAWCAGIPERIGYGRGRLFFLTQPVAEPAAPMHQVDYFAELLYGAGFERGDQTQYRLCVRQQDREDIGRRLDAEQLPRYACFHLGANWEPKRWPAGHFAQLADLLHDRWQIPVVITGAPGDLPLAEDFSRQVRRARVILWTGTTTLGQLAALFEKALFLVSADSGPMHIASAAGAPVLALFGPTDPELTGPRGVGQIAVLRFVPEGCRVPWMDKALPEGGWLERLLPETVLAEIEKKEWWRFRKNQTAGIAGEKTELREKRPKQVLLITLSNIGDVIMTTPVMASLKSAFPDSELTVVAGTRAQGILQGSRIIDRLLVYDKKKTFRHKWELVQALRERDYDFVLDLRHTVIPYLVHAKKRSPLLRHLKQTSMRARHLEMLACMGISEPADLRFDFFDAADERSAQEVLNRQGVRSPKNWIVVAPVAASELKTWPLKKYKEVIGALLQETPCDIFLVGDERESRMAASLTGADPERIYNLAGKMKLRELASVIRRSALVLSNDSAVMHLAYELGCPVVALFGPTDALKYGHEGPFFKVIRKPVFCSPCGQPACRFERQSCFEDLETKDVLETCRELLYGVER
ncbi:MAG: lipopolysaccharide heptosyltransferase II [Omnitrophica bacterium GWA2_52_8]|nr:MAG: lipopolysaccharide heptosyltransferase II [Omnitrophica bacterium GWA2_52_8]